MKYRSVLLACAWGVAPLSSALAADFSQGSVRLEITNSVENQVCALEPFRLTSGGRQGELAQSGGDAVFTFDAGRLSEGRVPQGTRVGLEASFTCTVAPTFIISAKNNGLWNGSEIDENDFFVQKIGYAGEFRITDGTDVSSGASNRSRDDETDPNVLNGTFNFPNPVFGGSVSLNVRLNETPENRALETGTFVETFEFFYGPAS